MSTGINGENYKNDYSPELIIALAGGIGTDFKHIAQHLKSKLEVINYKVHRIKLTEIIGNYTQDKYKPTDNKSFYENYIEKMNKCTMFRSDCENNQVMALLAVAEIIRLRKDGLNNHRLVYIIDSLKRHEEVEILRKIYGGNFILLSIYSSKEARIKCLEEKFMPEMHSNFDEQKNNDNVPDTARSLAVKLVSKDEQETQIEVKDYGQDLRNTFPLGDFFICGDSNEAENERDINRLLDIIFGHPYITPSKDELNMSLAKQVSFRSADPSRQVGAVITNNLGHIIASGCNDVPKFGGGQYWEGDKPDGRDYALNIDSNFKIKSDIVADTISGVMQSLYRQLIEETLKNAKLSAPSNIKETYLSTILVEQIIRKKLKEASYEQREITKLMSKVITKLNCINEEKIKSILNELKQKKSKIFDLLEYGRAVHAEEAAICDAANRGISLNNCTLYCTTFPCHLCAKHIIAVGIKKVVYIDPYPKSKVEDLFKEAIVIDSCDSNKVSFNTFLGVSPRIYSDVFRYTSRERRRSRW